MLLILLPEFLPIIFNLHIPMPSTIIPILFLLTLLYQ